MALGAAARRVSRLVLQGAVMLVAAGVAISAPVAGPLVRFLASRPYDVGLADPATVTSVLAAVAMARAHDYEYW